MGNVLGHLGENLRAIAGLARSRRTQEAGLVFSGNLANKALTFLVHLILIRTLSTRDFVLFSVAVIVLEVLAELADLGLNVGLVRNYSLYAERDPRRAHSIVWLILRAKILWTLVLTIGAYLLAPGLCRWLLKREELTPFIQLSAAGLFAPVLVYFLLAHLQAARLFFRYVFISVFGRAVLLAAMVLLAVGDRFTLATALTAYVFIPLVTVAAGFLLVPRESLALRRAERGVAHEVFHFGKWVTLSSILVLAYMRLDVFMLTALSTEEQIAGFVIAVRFASLANVLIAATSTALLPHVGRLQTVEGCRNYLRNVRRLIPLVAIGVGVLCLIARPLLVLPVGPKAAPAVPIFRLLLIAYSLTLVARPFALLLYRLNRVDLLCLKNAVELLLCFGGNWLLIPTFGGFGAAMVAVCLRAAAAVSTFVFVAYALRWAARTGDLDKSQPIDDRIMS